METRGWFYDGSSAARYEVRVEPGNDSLRILFLDGNSLDVPAARLIHVESRPGHEIYGRDDLAGWRLGLALPVAPEILRALPEAAKYGRWIDRVGLVRAILAFVAISALVIFIGGRLPVWAAPYVPAEWEKSYGDALVGDFGGKFCSRPEGQRR